MVSSPLFNRHGQAYIAAVIALGFGVIGLSVYQLTEHPVGVQWFLLAGLTLVSGSATVKLPSVPASISISETFVVAAVLLYGSAAGTLTVALDGLVISFWIAKRRQELYRALFNMSAPALSVWCAAQLFFWLSGTKPLFYEAAPLNQVLPALVVFALTYFGLNSWLIAFAISLEKKVSALKVWRENFVWLSLNYFCGASVAVLLVVYTREIDLRFVGVIVPLLLVLYFTFKTSMDRVEDANRHVDKVNRLYLSTIETLAMAIDAKDQVTHGHIRRVQRFAVGLAQELGVRDGDLVKAIEAAALLHDMGKLAVPEHILNKPGRLTDAEFEKMKLHASVGADILSAIDFPYPVVPIVRHHHESWDGTGYPDGLKGTEIPIGARILSVVDCFDALTSDRPYRRRLSNAAAIEILNERKGSMYDPWVVETFERVHELLDAGVRSDHVGHAGATAAAQQTPQVPSSTAGVEVEGTERGSAWRPHNDAVALECEALLLRVRPLVPVRVVVLYRYDAKSDLLVAHQIGGGEVGISGTRVALGDRLSGWVAANRQVITNSDAALDLGDLVSGVSPPLSHCMALPVVSSGSLVGVLSLYACQPFSPEHERLCRSVIQEVVASADSSQAPRLAVGLS